MPYHNPATLNNQKEPSTKLVLTHYPCAKAANAVQPCLITHDSPWDKRCQDALLQTAKHRAMPSTTTLYLDEGQDEL
uniref:Piwi domain-containing protein n=1 Tax=Panagrellus redivivus TaxID=6233 RepID=A0A7E4UTE2_PANRE